jgi:quinol monooxygenase YgiN
MANKGVTVIARVRANEGKEEIVRQELAALIAPTRSEPGCVTYNLHQGADNKALFMVHESWASKHDLDEHLKKPYLKAFLKRANELLVEPVEITLWEQIG